MASKSDIAVVIPVRDDSSRVKEKVYLPFFDGKNLLEWKISQIKEIHDPEKIFVSSNSKKAQKIAETMGIQFIPRADYLCEGHTTSFSEVVTGVIKDVPSPYYAWVTVVVPLMKPSEYAAAFEEFMDYVVMKKTHDSLVTVNLLKEYLWDDNGPLNYKADRNHTVSQDLPNLYRVTNGLYMNSKKETMQSGYFLGPNPKKHIVGHISAIDIDEYEDYELALAFKANYERT